MFAPFRIGTHNSHYEGGYADSEMEWRRLGAVDKVKNLQSMLPSTKVINVLEVGCGTGAVLAEVAEKGIGLKHFGIDVANPDEHFEFKAKGLDLREYDGQLIPFENDTFDLVYASHVIEHVPDPRGLLAEMKRVSRKLIYLEVPCELHLRTNRSNLQTSLNIGHINCFTPDSFAILIQTSGINIIDLKMLRSLLLCL